MKGEKKSFKSPAFTIRSDSERSACKDQSDSSAYLILLYSVSTTRGFRSSHVIMIFIYSEGVYRSAYMEDRLIYYARGDLKHVINTLGTLVRGKEQHWSVNYSVAGMTTEVPEAELQPDLFQV